MEWSLEHVHIFAGTPWWGSIILTTVAVRLLFFPAFMMSTDTTARVNELKPQAAPLSKKMDEARKNQDTQAVMAARSELSRLYKRNGISQWKSFTPLLQGFLGYGTYRLIYAMAELPVPGLEDGGVLWFGDLSIADPTYALPVMTALVMHALMRVSPLYLNLML
jgi:YidC/Oxa1 family membrane protein insertase